MQRLIVSMWPLLLMLAACAHIPPEAVVPLPTVAAKSPASTALNLATLEQRLRDTRAIGVFTKLSLKNQGDDLLREFRALYRGKVAFPLRQSAGTSGGGEPLAAMR